MLSTNSRGLGEISTESLAASDFCPSLSGVLDDCDFDFCESEVFPTRKFKDCVTISQSFMIARQSLKTDPNSPPVKQMTI